MWLNLETTLRVEFGIDKAGMWRLTERRYAALLHRLRLRERRLQDVLVQQMGNLIAMVGNTGFRGWKEPLKAEWYIPKAFSGYEEEVEVEETKQQLADRLRKAFLMSAGIAGREIN